MTAFIEFIICMALSTLVMFIAYWLFNPTMKNGISFREWWQHRPTWSDPYRYEKFLKSRKG